MRLFVDPLLGTRYVVVVRRGDETTFRHLQRRLARVRGVEVTLDRRTAPRGPWPEERRAGERRFNAFGVLLVRH